MRRIIQARDLGHILIGWPASTATVDKFLIECHEQKLTSEQILERARAAPPKPGRLDRPVPDWRETPRSRLLGPWVEPVDLHDAVRMLRGLEALLDKRDALLAMAYYFMQYHVLWTAFPDCENLEQFCIEHLGLGQRSFQRYAQRGLDHFSTRSCGRRSTTGSAGIGPTSCSTARPGATLRSANGSSSCRRLGRTELHAGERDVDPREEYAPPSRWLATWRRS